MTWRPDLTVATIVERDGRFLIIEERIDSRPVLNQPAGHVEDGETILDAAIRETGDSLADYEYPDEVVTGMQRFIEVAQQARQAQEANIEGAGLWTRMLDEMGTRAQTGALTAGDAQKI